MKKIIILVLILIIPSTVFSQEEGIKLELFANDLNSAKDAVIKLPVCDESKCGDLRDIFVSLDPDKYYNGKKKGAAYSFQSNYSKLSEQQFKIIDFKAGNPTGYSSLGSYLSIELFNPQLGTIYVKTYSKAMSDDLVIISDVELPKAEVIYCSEFIQREDKFEGTKTTYTSLGGELSFIRVEKDGDATIYMRYQTRGSTLNVGEKGASFIFENGEIYSFPEAKIEVESGEGASWNYSTFITLTSEEIKLFMESPISDAKLYIYTREYNTEYTEQWRQQLICLVNDTFKDKG